MSTDPPEAQAPVDEYAARAAFARFMLTGKKHMESKQAQESSITPFSVSPSPALQLAFTKTLRKYQPILSAFYGCLVRDWLQVDDNLGQVFYSVANLRQRVWLTSRLLAKIQPPQSQAQTQNPRCSNRWKGRGFVDASAAVLPNEDLRLALTHDLLQHERMLAGVRKLLAAMSQAQDALGRRLDELLSHHMDAYELVRVMQEEEDDAPPETLAALEGTAAKVEECQLLYVQTAQDLYRKQTLAARVLDSAVNDALFFRAADQDNDDLGGDDDDIGATSPRQVAQQCVDAWPRTHRSSHLRSSAAVLQDLMRYA